MEKYRNARLGTFLVSGLTRELLERNITPFNSASIESIDSQMAAGRCGYILFWIDTFVTIPDGSSVYNDIMGGLLLNDVKMIPDTKNIIVILFPKYE